MGPEQLQLPGAEPWHAASVQGLSLWGSRLSGFEGVGMQNSKLGFRARPELSALSSLGSVLRTRV